MGLNRLKRGYLIQFKRYVDQLTGSSGPMSARISGFFVCNKALNRQEILEQTHCHIRLYGIVENGLIVARNLRSRACLPGLFLQ